MQLFQFDNPWIINRFLFYCCMHNSIKDLKWYALLLRIWNYMTEGIHTEHIFVFYVIALNFQLVQNLHLVSKFAENIPKIRHSCQKTFKNISKACFFFIPHLSAKPNM